MASWGSLLGSLLGGVLAPITGGASLAIGSALGGAADLAMDAKKKPPQQQVQGRGYQPLGRAEFDPAQAGGVLVPTAPQMTPEIRNAALERLRKQFAGAGG